MELNDVLRLLFKQCDENFITIKEPLLTIHVYKNWIYETGGWIEIEWNLDLEFLNQQSEKTQGEINKYLII